MSKNKIVEYYKPNDERLGEYYFEHLKLLGLDKQPFGLDQNGTLRFETTDTDSKIWKRYKELGGSEEKIGDLNTLAIEFQHGKFTLDEYMQFNRENGWSLCGFIDSMSDKFYEAQDKIEFQLALDRLRETKSVAEARQDILETIFAAQMDSAEDELIFNYRKEAKKIINANFGEGAWKEFIDSIKNKK